jgi:hypothetical protein
MPSWAGIFLCWAAVRTDMGPTVHAERFVSYGVTLLFDLVGDPACGLLYGVCVFG